MRLPMDAQIQMIQSASQIFQASPTEKATARQMVEPSGARIVTHGMIRTADGSNPISSDAHQNKGSINSQYSGLALDSK